MFASSSFVKTAQLAEYGGYYYMANVDGSINVRLPGSHEFFTTMPNLEVFKRFVEQANNLFVSLVPTLKLHLTGCKRCQKSADSSNSFFDPCQTGKPLLLAGREVAQEASRIVAEQFLEWWNEQQRLSTDATDAAQDIAGVPKVRSD